MRFSRREWALLFLLATLFALFNASLVWEWLYPIRYEGEIAHAAARYEVDPYLLLAIIRIESKFNPYTVSEKGAVGLMQLMPETAAWVAKKAGLPRELAMRLEDPAVNVTLGAWYVRYLLDRFAGNTALAVAAYNAGPNAVDRWLDRKVWDGRWETVSAIPYGETRHFVQRVLYYHGRYRAVYEDRFAHLLERAQR